MASGPALASAAAPADSSPIKAFMEAGVSGASLAPWAIILEPSKSMGIVILLGSTALMSGLLMCRTCRLSADVRSFLRFLGFVTLHVADYASNIAMMLIVWRTGHHRYLYALVPVHLTIGLFCIYTAATNTDWQRWVCGPLCNFVFMVIVLGLMQGIQVKLARDDFVQQRRARRMGGASVVMPIPAMMPARYQCKAMDGILEGTVFAFVAMYALLKRRWITYKDIMDLTEAEAYAVQAVALLSFLTVGLALMEVDHRTSAAVQRLLNQSALAQMRHLIFRASEFSLRLLTVMFFCVYMRPHQAYWLIAFGVVIADYLTGVLLLVFMGGRDPVKEAAVLLGMPLFMVNVIQFVDTPGMSLRARRITAVIAPLRALELVCFVLAICVWSPEVSVERKSFDTNPVKMSMWDFLWDKHYDSILAWAGSAVVYYTLYLTYACHVKPEADVHSAVALGDVACLRELVCGTDLVLDINRYGPDGRTPLHLAALCGHVECMRLLIEEGANMQARTGDRLRNTVLHLAAQSKYPKSVRFLCRISSEDAGFLNATNAEGDTALHIAARRQNVSVIQELLGAPKICVRSKNAKHQTPADCAPSDKFGFDRNSPECVVAELLRDAERGIFPQAHAPFEAELPEVSRSASSASAGAANSPEGAPNNESNQRASIESLEGTDGEDNGADLYASQHGVPLVAVSSNAEADFLRRNAPGIAPARMNSSAEMVTSCGISSFMLSAGLGALSRAFLSTIHEGSDTGASTETSAVKATFEDFAEVKMLGEGAFGKVLLVRQKATGELFAMKLMDKAKFRAQKITSKAHSEQYILKTTRHPFIVSLHYAFQGSTFWALVMDYCPNGDLQFHLGNKGKPGLSLDEAARFGGEVMLALEHLHSIRVIFRDLKLENVVLDPDYRAKVTDFGLAKKLQNSADARTMCGSYGYAAPEIMLNVSKYTYAVDLYSFGVMLYLLLCGGESAPNNPKQRLPPMKHSGLRRRLREAEKEPRPFWALARHGALELISKLTSEDPRVRGSPADAKRHRFFESALGRPVDSLLKEDISYAPNSAPSSSGGLLSDQLAS